MTSARVTTRVAAPIDHVFGVFTDIESSPGRVRHIHRVQLLTSTGFHLGTRWRETRELAGREVSGECEVTDFEAGRQYTISAEMRGARVDARFSFTPVIGATDVTLELELIPQSFGAVLAAPVGRLMFGPLRRAIEADLADLRLACEQPSLAAP